MISERIVRYSKKYKYPLSHLLKKKKKDIFWGIKLRLRSVYGIYDLAKFILFRDFHMLNLSRMIIFH